MFQHTRRVHTLLAGATGLTLVLGVGVAVGAVPRPVSPESEASVHAAAVTPGAAAVIATGAPAVDAPVPPPTTEAATTVPTAPPTTGKAAGPAAGAEAAPAGGPAPVAADPAPVTPSLSGGTVAAAPSSSARANPTSAQVQAAIQQIATRIPFFSVATEAQARQFGDAVCTAFDQGNTYAQVRTQVQQALSQLPMVTIKPADMDFAIRTAVQLFCPGYTSKLV